VERRHRAAPLRDLAVSIGAGGVPDGVKSHTACIVEKACAITSS
jgi:hypothetical protein